ncbi:vitamin K epoxide reductase family protein [Salinibacter altiplanensis]|uniref:vitamin K epoxide reductase family protein n=1 Tax=Salinibacter altiplanensis TaxID=1803181 RepID=UPI001F333BD0|nr:vitamin K epoxide reductase family protein [Salinibacter altiplanensis]
MISPSVLSDPTPDVDMVLVQTLRERLRGYRPRLELLVFGLSLLGILDVVHLRIQQGRGFKNGCLGTSSFGGNTSLFDCAAVTTGPGHELLGVDNTTWGLGFYGMVGLLTVIVFWVAPALREWGHGARFGLLTGGVAYSAYLTYLQVSPPETVCLLCLGSAFITTFLFAGQVALLASSLTFPSDSMSSRLVKRQIALFVYFIAAAAVLVGTDLVYFNGEGAQDVQARSRSASGSVASAQCELDDSKAPLQDQGSSLVGFQDIAEGSNESGVTVVEYFDPNCPHCKDFHQVMKQVVEAHRDEVRFVYKPFPLRRSSLPEIQALYVAAQSDKFDEMLEAQYARQGPNGISTQDLRAIADDIDLDPNVLTDRVEQNEYRDQILQQRKQAVKIGVDSTPTVLINGHFVESRTKECLNTFVEQAKSGTLSDAASG